MISVKDYDAVLKNLGKEYFIHNLQYVPDITAWAKDNRIKLSEPHQPMKLVTGDGGSLTMVVQSYVSSEVDDVIKNLGVRWAIKDTATNMETKLNSPKKRMAFCFLKEYARSVKHIDSDELIQDEWVLSEMESFGYFKE
ncbi:MAG: hypothetical protein C4538_02215 [Nitrospiraceae bacterium]|nr:MAG: hypothetical protein C4538_02215 [Nitrospiraceae bacterium]